MIYHHTKFKLPCAFHKKYMNVQICYMSTFISINIARRFRPANPQNAKIIISIKLCKKRETIFVYLPNTSHFMHFQSVRQKKGNNRYKTNEYRWHFRSKPHQTTSLRRLIKNWISRETIIISTYTSKVIIEETKIRARRFGQVPSFKSRCLSQSLMLSERVCTRM